jgi:hypothetical protein
MYADMHTHGERFHGVSGKETFEGISLIPHVHTIRRLVAETGAQNLLDYGAGKASLYGLRNFLLPGDSTPIETVHDFWDVDFVELYDPGYEPYSKLPQGTFGGVICTDVMEHLPAEDLPWILGEIFGYAERFVFLTIARYEADKRLPNGENAHITIKPAEWWAEVIGSVAASRPSVLWEARVEERKFSDRARLIREGVTLRGGAGG